VFADPWFADVLGAGADRRPLTLGGDRWWIGAEVCDGRCGSPGRVRGE